MRFEEALTDLAGRNAYHLLGLAPGAIPSAVRSAYRRSARAAHPDSGGDPMTAGEKLRLLEAASCVLTLDAGRYDRILEAARPEPAPVPPRVWDPWDDVAPQHPWTTAPETPRTHPPQDPWSSAPRSGARGTETRGTEHLHVPGCRCPVHVGTDTARPSDLVADRGTNAMAVLALVGALLLPPLGVVLGLLAHHQLRRFPQEGSGLATAGIVVGGLFTAFSVLTLTARAVST